MGGLVHVERGISWSVHTGGAYLTCVVQRLALPQLCMA
jgi:hypothetical protein